MRWRAGIRGGQGLAERQKRKCWTELSARRKVHEEPVPEPPATPPATEIHRTVVVGGFFIAGAEQPPCVLEV